MTKNDIYEMPYLKMMLYGDPGVGKTTLIGTACEDERLAPVLYLNVKGNPQVLRHNDNKPEVIEIREMEDFNAPYAWLTEGQKLDSPFCKEHGLKPPYKTVVVDCLTEVQRHVVRKVSGGERIKPGHLMPLLQRQGFGQLLGTMLNWGNYYLELPFNIILATHEAHKEDGSITPLLWGQSGNELASVTLLVGRLITTLAMPAHLKKEVGSDAFNVLQTVATHNIFAKDQYGLGKQYIANPTMTKVMDLIEQGS